MQLQRAEHQTIWRTATLFWILCVGLVTPLMAHPHIWVDLQVTPIMDDQGHWTGLAQRWQFDPFYSLVLAEDLQDPQRLNQLKSDIWNNLEPLNFYTEITLAEQHLSFSPQGGLSIAMDGLNAVLSFELSLNQPISATQLQSADIQYRIFEPTYYLDMMHQADAPMVMSETLQHCNVQVMAAQPSAEHLQRAIAADDPDVAEDPTLGQHFAQTVVIRCAQ